LRKIVFSILFFILALLIQFFLGRYLNILGVFPNFILITIVFLGMLRGRLEASVVGFLFGFVWDVFSADIFGMRMLIFTLIGYLSGLLSRNFDREQVYVQFITVLISNIFYWVFIALIYSIFTSNYANITDSLFSLKNIFSLLFTVIIAPPSFFVLRLFIFIKDRRN
jgi:rod shape-determining protein MreD